MIFKIFGCSLLVIVLCLIVINGELHRAKTTKAAKPKSRIITDFDTELTQSESSYVEVSLNEKQGADIYILSHSIDIWASSIFSVLLVAFTGVLPVLIIPRDLWNSAQHNYGASKSLQLFLSYAVGGLLGDVFFHLLPEVWSHIPAETAHGEMSKSGYWLISGLIIFMILEKLFPENEDEISNVPVDQYQYSTHSETAAVVNGGDVIAQKTRSHDNGFQNKQYNSAVQTTNFQDKADDKKVNGMLKQNGIHKQNGVHKQNGFHKQNGVLKQNVVHEQNGVYKQNGFLHSQAIYNKSSTSLKVVRHIKTIGWLNLLANFTDNFTHGLAVGASYCIGLKSGMLTTIAILLHEIPHEIGDFAILLKSGFERESAAKAQLLTASGGLFGAIFSLTASSTESAGDSTACLLSFTSGGFLYIALVTILPELLRETDGRESLKQTISLLCGIATMAFIGIYFE